MILLRLCLRRLDPGKDIIKKTTKNQKWVNQRCQTSTNKINGQIRQNDLSSGLPDQVLEKNAFGQPIRWNNNNVAKSRNIVVPIIMTNYKHPARAYINLVLPIKDTDLLIHIRCDLLGCKIQTWYCNQARGILELKSIKGNSLQRQFPSTCFSHYSLKTLSNLQRLQ